MEREDKIFLVILLMIFALVFSLILLPSLKTEEIKSVWTPKIYTYKNGITGDPVQAYSVKPSGMTMAIHVSIDEFKKHFENDKVEIVSTLEGYGVRLTYLTEKEGSIFYAWQEYQPPGLFAEIDYAFLSDNGQVETHSKLDLVKVFFGGVLSLIVSVLIALFTYEKIDNMIGRLQWWYHNKKQKHGAPSG